MVPKSLYFLPLVLSPRVQHCGSLVCTDLSVCWSQFSEMNGITNPVLQNTSPPPPEKTSRNSLDDKGWGGENTLTCHCGQMSLQHLNQGMSLHKGHIPIGCSKHHTCCLFMFQLHTSGYQVWAILCSPKENEKKGGRETNFYVRVCKVLFAAC